MMLDLLITLLDSYNVLLTIHGSKIHNSLVVDVTTLSFSKRPSQMPIGSWNFPNVDAKCVFSDLFLTSLYFQFLV